MVPLVAVNFHAFYGNWITLPHSQHSQLVPSKIIWIQSTLQLYFLQIRFNIVPPATPSFCKWSLSIKSHHQNPLCTSSVSLTCHMTHPCHSCFNDPENIGWGAHYAVSSSPCHHVPLRPKYIFCIFPSTLFSNTFSLCFFLNMKDRDLNPWKTTCKITILISSVCFSA
jgi:hypothetical protein